MSNADSVKGGDNKSAAPRRRWGRRVLIGLGALVGVLMVLVLLAPTLLSTGAGKGFILSAVNARIAGKANIGGMALGWFSGQRVEDLELLDPEGRAVVRVKAVEAPELSLWDLLRGSKNFGTISVNSPAADIVQRADGSTNLAAALKSKAPGAPAAAESPAPAASKAEQPSPLRDVRLKLNLTDGQITYAAPGIDTVSVSGLNVHADLPDLQHIAADAKGSMAQTGSSGQFDMQSHINNLFTADGAMHLDAATGDTKANLINLPVAALDGLLKANHRLAGLLGPMLNGTLAATYQATNGNANFTADTANFHANAALTYTNRTVVIDPATTIHLTVTPNGWNALTAAPAGAAKTALTKNFVVQLDVKKFQSTLTDTGIDLGKTAIDAAFGVTPIVLSAPDLGGTIELRDTTAAVTSDALGKVLNAKVHSMAEQDRQPGTLDMQATLTDLLTPTGSFNRTDLTANISGTVTDLPLAVIDKVGQLNGLLAGTLGPKLNATLGADFRPTGSGTSSGTFTLAAAAQNISANVSKLAVQTTRNAITVAEGGQAEVTIQPALAAYFLSKPSSTTTAPASGPRLAEPLHVAVNIGPLSIPLTDDKAQLPMAALKLGATVDRIAIADAGALGSLALLNTQLTVDAQHLGGRVNIALHTTAPYRQQTGKADMTAVLTELFNGKDEVNAAGASLNATGTLQSFPVALLDVAAGQQGKLMALIGEQLATVQLQATSGRTHTINFTSTVEADRLKAKLGGKLTPETPGQTGQHVTLDPSTVELTITPEGYAAWTTANTPADKGPVVHTTLQTPLTLKADISQAELGWKPTTGTPPKAAAELDPQQVKLALKLTSTGATFRTGTTAQTMAVQNLSADMATTDLTKLITVALQMAFVDPNSQATAGRINSKTQAANLTMTGGKIAYDNATIQTDTTLENVPVALLDQISGRNGELVGLLGNSGSATLRTNITPTGQSPLDLTIDSSNTKAKVAATIDGGLKSGTLRLREDATVSLMVTPELSKAFLAKVTGWVNPSSGEKPIALRVHHDKFAMPVGDLDLKKIVGDADLDMGVLNMQSNDAVIGAAFSGIQLLQAAAQGGSTEGLIGLGAGLFNKGGGKAAPPQTVVFTPMTAHLANGVVAYSNLTMTLQNLTFAFSGNVDLTSKANTLTMAIQGQSIAKAFPKWAGSFGPGTDIVIPIGGTYDAPKPNIKEMGPQMLKLIGNLTAGKGKGGQAGQLLQGLGGLLDRGSKNPPPPTNPQPSANPTAVPLPAQQPPAVAQPANPPPPATKPADDSKHKGEKILKGFLKGLEGGSGNPPATQPRGGQ